ncbi:trimethylamine-N-oxide reductase (cytochrome c) [Cupriavidus sp. YR651]|uniref:molybdopterin-dependent oxidoreductase n=1 Tax=Cupriavidus sp. YR651 TaxID=1855315 RepID=UPI0008841D02|nr:molybdopterin-dependent oxidoreductase [Cupriavidus sp. YR651]SDD66866.1 trimethylamine-N-oxide reductase (cytochrome c) [Cupriavidus sp. YR651]
MVSAAELFDMNPAAKALAKTVDGASGSMANFTGSVAHATHYGPFVAMVERGKIKKIAPTKLDAQPNEMLTQGVLARTYDKTRIAGPMVRKSYLEGIDGNRKPELRGKEEFIQVSWEVALGLTAKAILDTIEKHGNESIFSSSYGGWSHAGIFRPNVLQGRFFNLVGGCSYTTGDYSGGAAQIVMPYVIGDLEVYSPQTAWEQVRDNTEVFLLVGCDPDKNNRIEYTVADHEMFDHWAEIKKAGVRFISINPQFTTTDEKMGSEWVRIVPNTDTALFLAMSHHLHVTGKYNKAFIDQYTVGFDRFLAYLSGKDADGSPPKTPEWAEKITGIPAGKIRELAELMASKRTQIAGSWSIQRAHHGEMPYWAIVNFACMLGNIGLPGQGIGFSWHYGGGGTAQSGGTGPLGIAQGRNAVKKLCPASRISEMLQYPGKAFTYNGSQYTYPLVKMIYNAGVNFMSHQQNLNELIKAMRSVDTVVVQDCWWCASARWADIVLPATTTLERNDISSGGTYSNDKIFAMKQAIAPQGDALDDYEIFRRLSALLGVELGFSEGKTQMEHVKLAYEGSSAAKHMSFEKFWKEGVARLDVPAAAHRWVRHGDFRSDPAKHPLHTPTGKIEMYSATIEKMKLADCPPLPKFLEPAEYLGNAKSGQLHVVSPHPYNRLHSQMANAEPVRELYAVTGREPLVINREDAAERGIREGDAVELYNERGAIVVGAVLSDKIMRGVVSIYEGAWPQIDRKGRCNNGLVNFITSSRPASGLSQATVADTCLAYLRKCTDAEGPSQAYVPPRTIRKKVAFDSKYYGLDRSWSLRQKATMSMSLGERIFYQRCTVCHGPRDPGQFSEKQWLGITQSMFPRAGLNDEERKAVLEFLLKNAKK